MHDYTGISTRISTLPLTRYRGLLEPESAAYIKHELAGLSDTLQMFVCRIIAKVEDADALRHLDKVLDASDGIIIARGTLGMEISPEKVALAQNLCITKCNIRGKVGPLRYHYGLDGVPGCLLCSSPSTCRWSVAVLWSTMFTSSIS